MQSVLIVAGETPATAPSVLPPEPEWITRATDVSGFAWARAAWVRSANEPGAWFDHALADAVVDLWPKYFTLTDDRFAGVPFRLNFWQEVIVRLLVGWQIPVEVLDPATGEKTSIYARLFKQLRLWVPRKNGKSEFLAALALFFWAMDGVRRGLGVCFARNEDQARMVFDKMSDMVEYSPDALKKRIKVQNKYLWIQKRKAAFRLLPGTAKGKHGRGPVVIVGDEMHEWESLTLMTTLRQGTGTRLQPIELYASTSGPKSAEIGWRLWDQSIKISSGAVDDATTLVVIFAADEDDDWTDEVVWKKANPSLGLSPTLAFLRRECALAKNNPRAEAEFRCYHLNQWVEEIVRWLPKRKWERCGPLDRQAWKQYWKELKGRACYAALDVSSTQDFTALILLFPPQPVEIGPPDRTRVVCRFWVPEDVIVKRTKEDRLDYQKWKDAGALEATPGDCVDLDFVRTAVKDALTQFNVLKIGRDPWNSLKLVTDLQKDGVKPELFVDLRQGHATLGEPTKAFEKRVFDGRLDHGHHPVLGWMAGNAHVRFDENLNFVPAKKRSKDKIDGIQGCVMCEALSIEPVQNAGVSVPADYRISA